MQKQLVGRNAILQIAQVDSESEINMHVAGEIYLAVDRDVDVGGQSDSVVEKLLKYIKLEVVHMFKTKEFVKLVCSVYDYDGNKMDTGRLFCIPMDQVNYIFGEKLDRKSVV